MNKELISDPIITLRSCKQAYTLLQVNKDVGKSILKRYYHILGDNPCQAQAEIKY